MSSSAPKARRGRRGPVRGTPPSEPDTGAVPGTYDSLSECTRPSCRRRGALGGGGPDTRTRPHPGADGTSVSVRPPSGTVVRPVRVDRVPRARGVHPQRRRTVVERPRSPVGPTPPGTAPGPTPPTTTGPPSRPSSVRPDQRTSYLRRDPSGDEPVTRRTGEAPTGGRPSLPGSR